MKDASNEKRRVRPLRETLKGYGRSIAGALLFALPAVYTMEIWWRGFISSPLQLLALVIVGFLLLVLYEVFTGLHDDESKELGNAIFESCESILLGFVIAWALLWSISFPSLSMENGWAR